MNDPYLTDIARRYPSHAPLGAILRVIYERQIATLGAKLQEVTGRAPGEIQILDWGCGRGHNSYLLRKANFDVTAADVASEATDSAFGQDTPIIHEQGIEVIPLEHEYLLPFADASFDCVTSFGVLEHVPNDLESMKEVARVLRPGGVFNVTFLPYTLSWTQRLSHLRGDFYHDHLYSKRLVRTLAAEAGLEIESMTFGQFFPKNSAPLSWAGWVEPLDRFICRWTPLQWLATNLEIVLRRPARD